MTFGYATNQLRNPQKLLTRPGCDLQPNSKAIINDRGGQNKNDESRIPPHVKDIACTEQQEFPDTKWHAVEQHGHD